MVQVLVKNAFLTTEVVFYGDAERLDEIDDGLLLDEDPRLSLLLADRLARNLWHDVWGVRVRRVDVTVYGRVPGTWNHTMRPKVLLAKIIADQNRRPSLYLSKLEVVRYEITKPSTVPNLNGYV